MKLTSARLLPLLKTAGMAMVVSCIITNLTTGIAGDFMMRWGRAFCFGWPFAYITNVKVIPWVRAKVTMLLNNI